MTLALAGVSDVAINLAMRDGSRWGLWVTALGVAVGVLSIIAFGAVTGHLPGLATRAWENGDVRRTRPVNVSLPLPVERPS